MIDIFYLLIVFPLAWEFTVLFNLNGDADRARDLSIAIDDDSLDPFMISFKVALFMLMQTSYVVWSILGLFTFQWPWFILLLSLGYIIPKNKFIKVNAVLSINLLIFLAINHFIYRFDIIKLF